MKYPSFPPGFCTFSKAPPTEVCFARQRSPEVSCEKWKWGFGELEMKRLWEMDELDTGLMWKWEVGNGNWKTGHANGEMQLKNIEHISKWGMGLSHK